MFRHMRNAMATLGFALAACGPVNGEKEVGEQNKSAEPKSETAAENKVAAAADDKKGGRLVVKELEPRVAGDKWGRQLKVMGENGAFYIIEKQTGDGQWETLKDRLNANGEFIDLDVERPAQYRVGTEVNRPALYSEMLEPLFDKTLSNENLCSPGLIQATRIFIPKGDFANGEMVTIGGCAVHLKARYIEINGAIEGFVSSQSGGGIAAGTLRLTADELKGEGSISLVGQQGASGMPGRGGNVGAPGESQKTPDGKTGGSGGNGQAGGPGGAGGNLELDVTNADLSKMKISLLGGPGGPGGLGGPGGAGGNPFCWRGNEGTGMARDAIWQCGKFGTSGRNGNDGAQGPSGRRGAIIRLNQK